MPLVILWVIHSQVVFLWWHTHVMLMAHLHCRRRTRVRIRTWIPVLYNNRELKSESESVQYNVAIRFGIQTRLHQCKWTIRQTINYLDLGLELPSLWTHKNQNGRMVACKMTSLINMSADWLPNYHKQPDVSPNLLPLLTKWINWLSNEPAITLSRWSCFPWSLYIFLSFRFPVHNMI